MEENFLSTSTLVWSHNELTILIELVIPTTILIIFSIVGILGNGCIVLATLQNKNLQNAVNWMIALNAIGDLIHQTGHFILAYYVYSGLNYTSSKTCYFLQIIPQFFLSVGVFYALLVGFDRLVSVVFPARYLNSNKTYYLTISIFLCIGYSCSFLIIGFFEVQKNPDLQLVCIIANAYQFEAQRIWMYTQFGVLIINLITYLIFWGYIKYTKGDSSYHQIARALSLIMIFVLGGWIGMEIIYTISSIIATDEKQRTVWTIFAGIPVNFSISMNYFMYFMFSTEYRHAFNKQLKFFIGNTKIQKLLQHRHTHLGQNNVTN